MYIYRVRKLTLVKIWYADILVKWLVKIIYKQLMNVLTLVILFLLANYLREKGLKQINKKIRYEKDRSVLR